MFISSAILEVAVGMVSLFVPIYLYTIGFGLVRIALYYAAIYALCLLLLPFGGMICRRHGYEHSILYSSPFLIIYFLALFAIPYHPFFAVVSIVAIAIRHVLYWPGYHANFATWSGDGERGKEVSNHTAINAVMAALAPAIGGLIVNFFGFAPMFILVVVLVFLSNVPLFRSPEHFEPREFSYGKAFRSLVDKANRPTFLAFLGFGEDLVFLVFWPLFIAFVIKDAFSIGAIVSLSMLANILVTLYVGKWSDDGKSTSLLKNGAIFAAGSWVVRPLIATGLGIFFVDSFYRIARNMVGVPLIKLSYERARQVGVMNTVVFFEMALALGKLLAALIAAAAFAWLPMPWLFVFVLAGAMTLLYPALTKPIHDRR